MDHPDECLTEKRWVTLTLPGDMEDERLCVERSEVWHHLQSRVHKEWEDLTMMERIDYVEICPSSVVENMPLHEYINIQQMLAMEGICEALHCLPYNTVLMDNPHSTVESFSLIRSVRNEMQSREMKSSKDQAESKRNMR